jgi:hypothetical protein
MQREQRLEGRKKVAHEPLQGPPIERQVGACLKGAKLRLQLERKHFEKVVHRDALGDFRGRPRPRF